MLTRQQLQRIAQRERIGLQAQERDYLQCLILSQLYQRDNSLVFKGGTALRLVYKGSRYSEDLDFNAYTEPAELQYLWSEVANDLRLYGVEAEIRNTWQAEVSYSFDISYQGPLFDGRDRTKSKVRIDLSLRRESVQTQRSLMNPAYDDIRPFVVTVLTPAHLIGEKIRALMVRSKPRDLYDLWLMSGMGWQIDREIIAKKLELYDLTYSTDGLREAIGKAALEWERDMRPLLSQYVAYEDIQAAIEKYLIQQ